MTSYLVRSIAPSMLPPPMTDTACSGPRPPKTTATLILRCSLTSPPVLLARRNPPAPSPQPRRRVTRSALPGRRSAGQQQRGLAHLKALVQHGGDGLGDRHLH